MASSTALGGAPGAACVDGLLRARELKERGNDLCRLLDFAGAAAVYRDALVQVGVGGLPRAERKCLDQNSLGTIGGARGPCAAPRGRGASSGKTARVLGARVAIPPDSSLTHRRFRSVQVDLTHDPSLEASELASQLHSNLSQAQLCIGKLEDASQAAAQALSLDPTNRKARYRLAVAHCQRGSFDGALRLYDEPSQSDATREPNATDARTAEETLLVDRARLLAAFQTLVDEALRETRSVSGSVERTSSSKPASDAPDDVVQTHSVEDRVRALVETLRSDDEDADRAILDALRHLSDLVGPCDVTALRAKAALVACNGHWVVLAHLAAGPPNVSLHAARAIVRACCVGRAGDGSPVCHAGGSAQVLAARILTGLQRGECGVRAAAALALEGLFADRLLSSHLVAASPSAGDASATLAGALLANVDAAATGGAAKSDRRSGDSALAVAALSLRALSRVAATPAGRCQLLGACSKLGPVSTVLRALPGLGASWLDEDSGSAGSAADPALAALASAYNAASADALRCGFRCVASLCARDDLVRAELRRESDARAGPRRAGRDVAAVGLVRLLERLDSVSPKRMVRAGGPSGAAYVLKKYASDYRANPLGADVVGVARAVQATLQQDGTTATSDDDSAASSGVEALLSPPDHEALGRPPLVEALCAVGALAGAGAGVWAQRLAAADVMDVLGATWEYDCAETREAGSRAAALLACRSKLVLKRIVTSGHVTALAAAAVLPASQTGAAGHARARHVSTAALARLSSLCASLDSGELGQLCGGAPKSSVLAHATTLLNDHARNCAAGGAQQREHDVDAAAEFLRAFLDRVATDGDARTVAESSHDLAGIRDGLSALASPGRRDVGDPEPAVGHPTAPEAPRSGAAVPDVVSGKTTPEQSLETSPVRPAPETAAEGDGYDSDGLRVVAESSMWGRGAVKEARLRWLAAPLADRVRWMQTSADVHVFVSVPRGTRGKDVKVDIAAKRLGISLSWLGELLEGPLERPCRASDALWALEHSDKDETLSASVVHIVLPKSGPAFWRSLFEGGVLRKTHLEILQEMVDADEPVQSYDELDPEAQDIVDQLRERQALVAAGHIDLERSFDDFRLVLGDDLG
ncbi:unnamed protein product [Pedinophyceae sp. YPF-701]|nr:unnamed protein product [Pedinophyceae sp. YPF-701]